MLIALNVSMLDISISVPKELSNVTINQGLLGNFNADPLDDLTTPSGTVLPSNSSEKDIFYSFGELCKYNKFIIIFFLI